MKIIPNVSYMSTEVFYEYGVLFLYTFYEKQYLISKLCCAEY